MSPARPPAAGGVPRWRFGDGAPPVAAWRELLDRGGVLAVPTESSYALAADPRNLAGVRSVYRIKGRDAGKPLPVVAASPGELAGLGVDPGPCVLAAAERLWPGPVTLVLPIAEPVPAAAGKPSLAVRVPADRRLSEILAALGRPLTATSANPSGEPALTDPRRLEALLAGHDAGIVDAGVLPGGAPSTLLAPVDPAGPGARPEDWRVLRPGRMTSEEIERRLGAGEAKPSNRGVN